MHVAPKAQKGVKGSVGAPMLGEVIEVKVKEGAKVKKGDPLVVVSAMKMEMVVNAPMDGVVKQLAVQKGSHVEGEDLLVHIE